MLTHRHTEVSPVGPDPRLAHLPRGLIARLDGGGHTVATVGGKGAGLDRLVRLRFRVPDSAALTTAAYVWFVGSNPALARLLRETSEAPLPGPDGSEADRDRIDGAFLEASLPQALEDQILAVADSLTGGGATLAVRSSATSEDLGDLSFAGQYLSVLDVAGTSQILEATRLVWASLWHPAPRAYRQRLGVREADLAMAVVLQRMVPADRSGVCFTSDPAAPGAMRIEAVDGLGEALVSGATTPDVETLVRPSLLRPDGSRPDALTREVARTALRVEEEFGGAPQDVEWSVVRDELWILQARAVTAAKTVEGDGFDTEVRSGGRYTPVAVSEMLPGVLPPLLWTMNGPLVEEGFRRLFHELGVLGAAESQPFGFLARLHGQAALDLDRVEAAAVGIGGGDAGEMERQYVGRVVTETASPARHPRARRLRSLPGAVRAWRQRRRAVRAGDQFVASVDAVLAVPTPLGDLRVLELLALRARLRDLAATGVASEVAVAVSAVSAYRALDAMLTRWLGDEGPAWAQRITRHSAGADTGVVGIARKLVAELDDGEFLAHLLRGATPEDVEVRLRAVGPRGEGIVDEVVERLEALGSRSVYGGETWTEDRTALWQVVLSQRDAVTEDPELGAGEAAAHGLKALETQLSSTWRWRLTRVLTGQVVDARRRTLRRVAADATTLLRSREQVKMSVLALGGSERRIILELGRRLARRGALVDVADVELLADWELDDLAAGRQPVPPAELERRRAAVQSFADGPALDVLVDGRGHSLVGRPAGSGGLTGWGAGAGVAKGRVRIVRGVADGSRLEAGDILVAPATDPSWTPLFLVAGAVVVERGGPLSHAAIVARELGVPAVLNAAGATTVLVDGDIVEVDGSTGTVRRLEGAIV